MIGAGLAITHRLVVSYVMTVGYIAITTGGIGYGDIPGRDIYITSCKLTRSKSSSECDNRSKGISTNNEQQNKNGHGGRF